MKNITSGQFKMIAKTQQGLEPLLEKELLELGAVNTQRHKRAVSFEGNKRLLYKVNLHSRLSLKILVPFFNFKAINDKQLYDAISSINWDDLLSVNGTLAVDGLLRSDYFNHSQYIALKTKDAIVDQFREKYKKRPDVDVVNPDLRLNLHIFQDTATLSLDSSNDSLHRRGYREDANKAPLNEVTAAAIVKMCGWNGTEPLMDGMCGSGTILSLDSNFTPIQNAEVILVLDNQNVDTVYTNNKGNFEIFFIASCATGCPDSKLLIRKNGFENKEYNITQEEDNNPKFDHDNIKVFLTPNK